MLASPASRIPAARVVAVLAVACTLVVAWPAPAQATYSGTNGPLLVGKSSGAGLMPTAGGAFVLVAPFADFGDARFSRGGDKVAYSTNRNGEAILRVRSAAGGDVEVARRADLIEEIAWSPNGQSIAFLTNGADGMSPVLYKVASTGGAVTVIKSLAKAGWDVHFDWHPTQDLLAVSFGSDIWTMNSSGGAVSQWTNECDYPQGLDSDIENGSFLCDVDQDGIARDHNSDQIRWEASGRGVALGMTRTCDPTGPCPNTTEWWLARLPVGSQVANPVVAWPPDALSDQDNLYYGDLAPLPSPDGAWYAYLDGTGKVALVSTGGTKRATTVDGPLFDWQPCGAGGCLSFQNGKPTTITLVNSLSGTCTPSGCTTNSLVTSGKVTPTLVNLPVNVSLQAFRGGSWKLVATKRPKLTPKSTYRATFTIPADATKCKVTATFPGSATYLSSTVTKSYLC